MKLGVFSVVLGSLSLEEAMKYLQDAGVEAIELGTGGFPGTAHVNAREIYNKADEIRKIKDLAKKYNLEISALSCHGNPVHPDKEIAQSFQEDFRKTILLAEQLGIDTVITFSGCPGDHENAKYPNWVTCPWPDDFLKVLDYQWDQVLIPYWKQEVAFAQKHGVTKIALEMHPGFCVYNPETLLRLRKAVGPAIGANFDPSHLYWQAIDVKKAIRALKGAIYHFHAKDTKIYDVNSDVNGVLDTKPYKMEEDRAWLFRAVGTGHDRQEWNDIFAELRMAGYDHVVSIEHEDSLMSGQEGLKKAIAFLKETMIFEDKGEIYWA